MLLGVTALGILALGGPSPSAHAGCEPAVTTLPTTLSNVSGIAYDGTSLWVTVDLEGLICQVAPDTGAVKRKIQFASHKIGGNAWDGSYLWQLAYEDKTISRIDLNTGQVTAVIATPGTGMCSGMTFDGQYLWVANFDEEKIYQIDQNRRRGAIETPAFRLAVVLGVAVIAGIGALSPARGKQQAQTPGWPWRL